MAGAGIWAVPNILFYVSGRNPFEGPGPTQQLERQMGDLYIAQRRRKRILGTARESGVD